MKVKSLVVVMLPVVFAACSNDNPFSDSENGSSTGIMDLGSLSSFDVQVNTSALSETETLPQTESDQYWSQFVECNFSAQNTTTISFNGTTPTITGVVEGDTVTADGCNVTVKSHNKGLVLKVTGTTTDGCVKVYSDKKWELLLNNANITSSSGAAINIQDGKCFVVIEGTNTLSDGIGATYSSSTDEDEKAVFFSEDDLRFSGKGSLTVNTTNAVGKNGITSDNDIFIRKGCRLTVSAGSGAGNGIKTKGDITMVGGVVNVTTAAAGSKALKAESDIQVSGGRLTAITSGGVDTSDSSDPSGCAALKADSIVEISGGEVFLKSTGQGGKGISSDVAINISGGSTWVITSGSQYGSSSDTPSGMGGGGNRPGGGMRVSQYSSSNSVSPKGVRSDGNIKISGGEIYVRTSGSNAEGLESKATLNISGGSTAISAYDDGVNAASITVSGGRTFAISTGQCDGVDSNGALSCSGGLLIGVASTLSSEDGLDCESTMTCSGGTMIGFSNGGMSQGARMSGRYFTTSVSGSAGQYLALVNGNTPISVFALPRTYSSGKLLYVTGALSSGSYSLVSGTTPAGGSLWMNWYEGASSVSGGSSSSVSL